MSRMLLMINRLLFILSLSFIFPSFLLFAAPKIDYQLEPEKLIKGQEAVFDITAAWVPGEEDYVFMFPKFETEGLQIKKQGESQESFVQDGKTWLQKKFTIVLLADGTKKPARVKPFSFVFIDPKSASKSEHSFSEIVIPVVRNWQPLFPWLIALIGGGTILFFVYSRKRKRKELSLAIAIENAEEKEKHIRKMASILASIDSSETAALALKEMEVTLKKDLAERLWIPAEKSSAGVGQILDIIDSQESIDTTDKEWLNKIFLEMERLKFAGAEISAFDARNNAREISSFLESHRIVSN